MFLYRNTTDVPRLCQAGPNRSLEAVHIRRYIVSHLRRDIRCPLSAIEVARARNLILGCCSESTGKRPDFESHVVRRASQTLRRKLRR